MQLMAEQLTVNALQQVEIIGTFFDAKHQLETQRKEYEAVIADLEAQRKEYFDVIEPSVNKIQNFIKSNKRNK